MTPERTLIALFDTPHEANLVLRSLIDSGYPAEDLSLIMPDEEHSRADRQGKNFSEMDENRESAKRVATGAGIGAALGATAAGLAALVIPGLGPVLAAGPLVAAFAGGGAGAVAGALGGTLVDIGIPDAKVSFYSNQLNQGHALVAVRTGSTGADRAEQILREHGALEVGGLDHPNLEEQKTEQERSSTAPIPPAF